MFLTFTIFRYIFTEKCAAQFMCVCKQLYTFYYSIILALLYITLCIILYRMIWLYSFIIKDSYVYLYVERRQKFWRLNWDSKHTVKHYSNMMIERERHVIETEWDVVRTERDMVERDVTQTNRHGRDRERCGRDRERHDLTWCGQNGT